jgi:hypothetical protein
MKLADEIVALRDREGASPFEVGLILTEVAHRRVFRDAVMVNLEALRMEDIHPTTAEGKRRAHARRMRRMRRS